MRKFLKKLTGSASPTTNPTAPPNGSASPTTNSPSAPPSPKDLFQSRADERAGKGDFSGAIVMYDEALRHAPTDTTILLGRSSAYMMSTPPKLDLALQDANAAIQYDPTCWQAWLQKGETCQRMGDLQGAEDAFVNSEGFATGASRFSVQRSLVDVRALRAKHGSKLQTAGFPGATTGTDQGTTSQPGQPGPVEPHTGSSRGLQTPATASPAVATQPPVTARSTVTTQPAVTSQPAVTTQSPVTAQPTVTTQPPVTSQPAVTTQPVTAQPTVTTQPPVTARPAVTSQPAATPQTPASNPPRVSQQTGPTENPPPYTPPALTSEALITRLTQLDATLVAKNKGSVSISPYTSTSRIDAVKLVYVGMTQLELTARELGTPTYLHPTFRMMAIDMLNYPGSTFLDMDCESTGHYEGRIPGTVTVSGYSEEYREHQLLAAPLLNLALEGATVLPVLPLDKIVERIRLLQRQPTLEDNNALRETLGLSQLESLESGFYSTNNRQRQIEKICMALTRSLYDAPTRFIDFSKARHFTTNTLGTATQGIGLQNFLFQILLGAELLIRLRKEPVTTSYTSLVTDAISALLVISNLWMQNVTIQGPIATPLTSLPPTSSPTATATTPPKPKYLLVAGQHRQQAEALIRFGEAMSWPLMDEARNYIETAYQSLISASPTVSFDVCDWLFGLVLPGKVFRHRIMCCLVYASPSIRSFNPAPFWDNGLVVKNKSYWPKRTVLGRVLGGLKNPKSVCGWIGPVPAPEGNFSGWIRLNARRIDVPVPVKATQSSLQSLGFGQPNETESSEEILQSITDPAEWIVGYRPYKPPNELNRAKLKAIRLTEIPGASNASTLPNALSALLATKEHRASLDFEVSGTSVSYTLYSNPIFLCAPPCVGKHVLHRRQMQNYLSSILQVADLKEAYPPSDELVVIDALGEGEAAVARAWCAERGKHAVVRSGTECCFACAAAMATERKGTGFNVLILSP
ncbi:MAG: hypothetical protein M1839_005769 [Geoglossum umbratile]|nr:MAG: hypothetical protein M1839_005769 [Geoglossum umbratile]